MLDFIKDIFSFENGLSVPFISLIIAIISNIFFALAINYDTKLNHIKYSNLWTSAAFFFGAGTVVSYSIFGGKLPEAVPIVCAKCGKKAKKNMKKCPKCGGTNFVPLQYEDRGAVRNRIIAFLAIAIVLLAFNRWYTEYSPWAINDEEISDKILDDMIDDVIGTHYPYEVDGEIVYYDREGNSYIDAYEVPYYDKNGKVYTYDSVKGYVSENDEIDDKSALVDSNGYIVDASVQFETVPDILPFKTQDGTMYYSADAVSWNKDGQMVYTSNGKVINNN